jgi:hypothetical protein
MRRGDVRVEAQKAKFLKNCANVRGSRTGSAAWSLANQYIALYRYKFGCHPVENLGYFIRKAMF